MLSVVALMVLLLPVLLRTTTSQKLTSLALGVHGSTSDLPPLPSGDLESVHVYREARGYVIRIQIRSTDVNASQGDTETKEFQAEDLSTLQERLAEVKALDERQERVILVPAPDTQVSELVRWMDAVRRWPQGELFPKVVLASEEVEAEG
jgi:hypothetical protein